MDGDGIGQFQFLQLAEIIIHDLAVIKGHPHLFRIGIDGKDDAGVTVINAKAFVIPLAAFAIVAFPDHVIVIFDLHDLIPLPEHRLAEMDLPFVKGRRVQGLL